MILAAGLTPAWQQIMLLDQFYPGEVNRAREVHWCASGKVLNVGRAGHALEANCKTLAMIGGPSGAEIRQEFLDDGIKAHWIEDEVPTRVCTTILDKGTQVTTELVEESRPPSMKALAEFDLAYSTESESANLVVLTGSLPMGVSDDLYRSLIQGTDCPVLLDVRGSALLNALPCRPFLVKPNREELGMTLGRKLNSHDDVAEGIQHLIDRGAEWVLVTDGGRPALAGSAEGLYQISPPIVNVVNPIGCGDCLTAGIAVALAEGQQPLDAVRFGMAAAAENATQLLPARLDRSLVDLLAEMIVIEAV